MKNAVNRAFMAKKNYIIPSTEVQVVNTHVMQVTNTGSTGGDQSGAQAPKRKLF